MSYRTIKRLLGETNFELKCLVLFGFGSTVVAAVTLFVYWWETSSLVSEHIRDRAKDSIAPILLQVHWKSRERSQWDADQPQRIVDQWMNYGLGGRSTTSWPGEDDFQKRLQRIEDLSADFHPEELHGLRWSLYKPDPSVADPVDRPSDDLGYQAVLRLRNEPELPFVEFKYPERNEFHYFQPITAGESCLQCHHERKTAEQATVPMQEGDTIAVAKVVLPLAPALDSLHGTLAVMVTAEFIKVVLAILGIYLVVRYVITKPVMHLKKVSDAIAHGNLDMRADIRTGDEFEELSHAFNRMLRHLVTVQDELRHVNADLDAKVDELAQVNLRLYETNNLKNEFLATMSHELRTPLNSILGFSDVLAGAANLSERQRRYAENIQTSGRNLLVLINDVLDLAKIESGKMELHPVEFSINDLIERQVGSMHLQAERKNIALTSSVDEGLPVLFQDAGKIQQIVNNLLSNAVKFTPEGGRVRVMVRPAGRDQLEIIVEDTGIGIPLEDQANIFEKFRQGKAIPGQKDALTRKYEGSGLGLSIVKELTKLLGGEVSVESEFGKGSTFSVRLPVSLGDDAAAAEDERLTRLVGLNRFTHTSVGGGGLLPGASGYRDEPTAQ